MRSSNLGKAFFAILAVCLFVTVGAYAQVGTTSLRGTVIDKTGSSVSDAKVSLDSLGQAFHREMQTNDRGEYEFIALPPGTYVLTVDKAGFRKYEQKSVQLLVNSPATDNITLEVGAQSQTIEVSAQAVTLNTTDASLGNAFNENQVRQLPLEGRNVPDLLSLQAGVVYTSNRADAPVDTDTRSGAVNGARSDQSNVTLDGVPVNDAGGHAFTSVLPVTLDSVQEFRTTTSNYNADQGGSSGAQVSMVYKSGTDAFHGSAYEYLRNTYTSANDFFVKKAQQTNCVANNIPLSDKQCNTPPELIRNVFGGSVGGPILKKRLYFFANYEGTRRAEAQSAVREVPSDALRAGYIQYLCADPTQCPGGQQIPLTTSSGKSYNYTVPAGYMALSPAQITAMDPLSKNPPPGYTGPVGPNPAVLKYLQQYPSPNDTSTGDGVNFSGFRFAAPIHDTVNWYIAKMDFNITQDAKQRLSVSAALANEGNPQAPFLPGAAPENTFLDFNKGIIVNYSGVISNTLVNNLRYGFVRQSYGNIGDSNQPYIIIRSLSQGVTRSSVDIIPSHTVSDDLSWTHRTHILQFGTTLGYTTNPRNNTSNSFSDGVANASWLDVSGMLVKNSPFNPGHNPSGAGPCDPSTGIGCYPAGDPGFGNAYDFPLIGLLGMVTEDDATYNYLKNGSVLPQGAPVSRHFAFKSYAWYAQDSWKVKPNLTFTYGVRYQIEPAPYETNGLQVATTDASGKPLPLAQWFGQRFANMNNGLPSNLDPLVSFDLAGPANGKPGLYKTDYHNFAPRLALAWSPKASAGLLKSLFGEGGKTTVRAGFGVAYDSIRSGLLDTFNSSGSFGMASTLSNPAAIEAASCAPRLTDMHVIPTTDLGCPLDTPANVPAQIFVAAPPGKFPQTFPNSSSDGGFCICWGLDDSIKTPYSYTLDFSVGRELPGGFSLEVSYVGRLAHRLLAQQDMAMPLDIKDKKSGLDYFTALTALAKIYRTGKSTQNFQASVSSLPANVQQYWADMIQPLEGPNAGNGGLGGMYQLSNCTGTDMNGNALILGTTNPTVAAYDLFCGGNLNETTPLSGLDYFGISDFNNVANCGTTGFPACNPSYFGSGGPNTFFNAQFSSLYGWRSNSNANYHAMQVNFRHAMSHGIQFDFNYTFSKSIDVFSDATRVGAWGGLGGQMINAWTPNAMRGVSDYDATHQFNANWVAELPFGRNKLIAGNANRFLDAIIGGWQLSGLFRMTSGFPVNISNGFDWPTNWQLGGNSYLTQAVKTGTYVVQSGSSAGDPNLFAAGPYSTGAIQNFVNPFPGQGGARNQIRGPGYFGIDMGLAHRWKMPYSERHSLQLRMEVFNVPNAKRFDVQSISGELDISSTFGNYGRLLTNPRVMQFALRYEF
jgi:hypothetical protein